MNVRLHVNREFLAAIWDPDNSQSNLVTNHYLIDMELITRTSDQNEINIAIDRIYYFMDQELSDTVFVGSDHRDAAEMLAVLGINVTTVPHATVDQIIGIMLFCKFQAIMERRVELLRLTVSSVRGHHVGYVHDHEEDLGPLTEPGWWHRADTQHSDLTSRDAEIDIHPNAWRQLELHWQRDQGSGRVVYADFRHRDAPK